jgi:tetratricopeptide (TPR) repeat protein
LAAQAKSLKRSPLIATQKTRVAIELGYLQPWRPWNGTGKQVAPAPAMDRLVVGIYFVGPADRMVKFRVCAIVLTSFLFGFAALRYVRRAPRSEPLFDGVGRHGRIITTTSPKAQRYFNQGLAFLYGFNHDEAVRSFQAAAESDPTCAMAYWGIAISNGPHINLPKIDRNHAEAAWKAIVGARKHLAGASRSEKALVNALSFRYSESEPANRHSLDEAYAVAMQRASRDFPSDSDICALAGESLLDLEPWNQWAEDGKARPGTNEIIRLLQSVLAGDPNHPLALHLLIHTYELSPFPEKADAAADRLRYLEPALGHLLHMPSHIDIRRGRWHAAVVANEAAVAADRMYGSVATRPWPMYVIYAVHNYHMLAFASMMEGQCDRATKAVHELLETFPRRYRNSNPHIFEGYIPLSYQVHLRFGHWDAMLNEPAPEKRFPFATALWHYGRAVAFAAQSDVERATTEKAAFVEAGIGVPKDFEFCKVPGSLVLAILDRMVAAEILYKQGKVTAAIDAFRDAVRLSDQVRNVEPPICLVPVRHALGAMLMDAGRHADAERVYREDLDQYPENGWSLYGLSRALQAQGKKIDAATVSARFDTIWKFADVKLHASCFCIRSPD